MRKVPRAVPMLGKLEVQLSAAHTECEYRNIPCHSCSLRVCRLRAWWEVGLSAMNIEAPADFFVRVRVESCQCVKRFLQQPSCHGVTAVMATPTSSLCPARMTTLWHLLRYYNFLILYLPISILRTIIKFYIISASHEGGGLGSASGLSEP